MKPNSKAQGPGGITLKPLVIQAVVLQVLQITTSDRDDVQSVIEQAVSRDPGFSARMISMANSPLFPTAGSVKTIKMALMALGVTGIRRLALSVGASDLFQFSDKETLRRAQVWWRVSCSAAMSARWLAQRKRFDSGDEAYLAGLLHASGKAQLLASDSTAYTHVETRVASGADIHEAERSYFGTDHSELTMTAVRTWGLPEAIEHAVNYRVPAIPSDSYAIVKALTAFGVAVGTSKEHGVNPELPAWALEVLGITEQEADQLIDECRSELSAA